MATNSTREQKATKPYDSFPLFPHRSKRWCKKIRQRFHYFGKVTDDDDHGAMAALAKYQEVAADLHAGRTPKPKGDQLTLADVVNRFLSSKRGQMDAGELTRRSWQDYYKTCQRLVAVFGKTRLVCDLDARDFEQLRDSIAQTRGLVARKVEITRIKGVFRYAHESGLIDRPMRFGPGFRPPSAQSLRKSRNGRKPRMLEPSELRAVLEAVSPQLQSLVLLGLNAALGNSDVSRMQG